MQPNTCAHLEICGGCQSLPGESYDVFLGRKMIPLNALSEKFRATPTVSSPVRTEAYRVKVEWRLRAVNGTIRLGYFKEASRDFFAVEACQIVHPLLQEFLRYLTAQKAPTEAVVSARLVAQLYQNQSKLAVILISQDDVVWLQDLLSHSPQVSYFAMRENIGANDLLPHGKSGSRDTWVRPGQFIQSHCEAEKTLQDAVWSIFRREGVKEFIELFCGNAHLSLGYDGRVVGYDIDILAAASQGDSLHRYFQKDLYTGLSKIDENLRYVLVDPGRSGLMGLASQLAEVREIKNIIYVSCNYVSLAVDVEILQEWGFDIKSWQVFDLFPWTKHWEMVLHLSR